MNGRRAGKSSRTRSRTHPNRCWLRGASSLTSPVTVEGEDPDIVRQFVAARELARLVEQGEAEPEDVEIAVEGYRDIYEYLVMDRAPP
jgi:hypothetical protein